MSTQASGTQGKPPKKEEKEEPYTYTKLESLSSTTSLWHRDPDGEVFFGTLYNPREDAPNQGSFIRVHAAAAVLNHENLVSLVDVANDPNATVERTHNTLLWDLCDAGTLANLLPEPPVKDIDNGFLPESLVWHVGLSIAKALAWLHEGWSKANGKDEEGYQKGWMPILHRDIRPENIFFEHPRGKETYGLCKLGNLGQCFVSGYIRGERTQGDPVSKDGCVVATPAAGRFNTEEASLKELKSIMDPKTSLGTLEPSDRPYTRGSELFALGSMLYRMMMGHEAPDGYECRHCDCWHTVKTVEECQHAECPFSPLKNPDWETTFVNRPDYSPNLKRTVGWLLSVNGLDNEHTTAVETVKVMEKGFDEWREKTEDGELYVSLEKDQALRKKNKAKKDEADRLAGIMLE